VVPGGRVSLPGLGELFERVGPRRFQQVPTRRPLRFEHAGEVISKQDLIGRAGPLRKPTSKPRSQHYVGPCAMARSATGTSALLPLAATALSHRSRDLMVQPRSRSSTSCASQPARRPRWSTFAATTASPGKRHSTDSSSPALGARRADPGDQLPTNPYSLRQRKIHARRPDICCRLMSHNFEAISAVREATVFCYSNALP
jgi:hypothetical protein